MISKVVILCSTLIAVRAGNVQAPLAYHATPAVSALHATHVAAPLVHYSPASEVSHVYSSIAAPASLAYAPTHVTYSAPAIGTTQQKIVRSFDGTISQHSKALDTPFSSVRKVDTRVNNNVYTPALAYAATPGLYSPVANPALTAKTITYGATIAPVAHVVFDGFGIHYAY